MRPAGAHRGTRVAVAATALLIFAAGTGAGGGAWAEGTARVGPDMDPDYRISGPEGTSAEWEPAVAWNGTAYLVVWMDERNHDSRLRDIYGRRVSADGSPIGGDFLISGPGATANDENPAVAWNGTAYLVVWSDQRTSSSRGADIYGRRVSAAGAPVGGDFLISGPGATGWDQGPDVVCSGTACLVVWSDERTSSRGADVYGRRVSAAGAPVGGDFRISGIGATSDDWTPAVAWDGTEYLVVWSDNRASAIRGADIYGRRVSSTGSPTGKDFRISGLDALLGQRPAVAWNGTAGEYLVVWQDNRNSEDRKQDIYGRVVLADGSLPKADFRISGTRATHDDESPAVAWSETANEYLVVWEDFRNSSKRGADIYGRVVLADGSRPGADFRISGPGATSSDWSPGVAWNGTDYLVVWQDFRDSGTRGSDIYGRRVGG